MPTNLLLNSVRMKYPKFKVAVRCFTFNQAKFITDAMDGFCMQNTSFPYVCIIVDDASTDGEQAVIQKYINTNFLIANPLTAYTIETEYAEISYAQHKKNSNCFFVVLFLKKNHYSQRKAKMPYLSEWRKGVEYDAICEGDDYWIDKNKLQKQVDFLDFNSDYSMCFSSAKIKFDYGFEKNDLTEMKSLYSNLESREYSGYEVLKEWLVPTCSMVFRSNVKRVEDSRFMFGDIILILSCAENGRLRCFSEKMVVYRRNLNGLSAKSQPLGKTVIHYLAIAENFGGKYAKICNNLISRNIASSILTGSSDNRKKALSLIFSSTNMMLRVIKSITGICFSVLMKRLGLKNK